VTSVKETKFMSLRLNINGEDRLSVNDPLAPLVDVLRDEFFLTGTKVVCREGFCGACTVLLDGRPVMSCLMPVGLADGCAVLTVESLATDGVLSVLQQAMEKHDAVQCGMCFPGMMIVLTHFLERTPNPSRDQLRGALTGNICRCTGYERVIDAALSLAEGSGSEHHGKS
jgi:carbon-monoxide dehydrogenase small subunit